MQRFCSEAAQALGRVGLLADMAEYNKDDTRLQAALVQVGG